MTPSSFNGALLPVCGVEVLVVVVRPWVLADPYECQLFAFAFTTRFKRRVVLMAQDADGVPAFFGPARLVRALCELPIDVIPWQRFAYRTPPLRNFMLPIPRDPDPARDAPDPRSASLIGNTRDASMRDEPPHASAHRHANTTCR